MKLLKKILPLFLFLQTFVLGQTSPKNLGINTSTPSATLDIIPASNTTAKIFEVNNTSGSELLTINQNAIGINSPTPTAKLEINAATGNSALRLLSLNNTKDKSLATINYNHFRPLMLDNNGNTFAKYDIRSIHPNAITFDGSYKTNGVNWKSLCTVNKGSILKFTVHTGFQQGAGGTGVVKYAELSWSAGRGFRILSRGHDFANTNANSLTMVGIGTNTISFSVTSGDNLVFEVKDGSLNYRQIDITNSTGRTEDFNIINSFRSR